MQKIKVLQLTNALGLGGTEKVLQLLSLNINKNIFEVFVGSFQHGGIREDIFKVSQIPVYILENSIPKLIENINEHDIDIVHYHSGGVLTDQLFPAIRKSKSKAIVRTNVFGFSDNAIKDKILDCDIFISKMCCYRYIKQENITLEDFLENRMVIYNLIDIKGIENTSPSHERILELKNSFNIKKDEKIIGRVGRADDTKFGDISIDMLPYLIKFIPYIKYIIVGMTSQKYDYIKKMGLEKYIITVEPTVDTKNLYEIYYLLDVFVHSSTMGESFGNVIAEAMTSKKPVVTNSTPNGDNAQIELVDHNVTGFVANTPRLYAMAIAYLLNNPDKSKQMGVAGHHKIKRMCNINNIVNMTEKLYIDSLLKKDVKLDEKILSLYNGIKYFPSFEELEEFIAKDYPKRLKQEFGHKNINDYFHKFKKKVFNKIYRFVKN